MRFVKDKLSPHPDASHFVSRFHFTNSIQTLWLGAQNMFSNSIIKKKNRTNAPSAVVHLTRISTINTLKYIHPLYVSILWIDQTKILKLRTLIPILSLNVINTFTRFLFAEILKNWLGHCIIIKFEVFCALSLSRTWKCCRTSLMQKWVLWWFVDNNKRFINIWLNLPLSWIMCVLPKTIPSNRQLFM